MAYTRPNLAKSLKLLFISTLITSLTAQLAYSTTTESTVIGDINNDKIINISDIQCLNTAAVRKSTSNNLPQCVQIGFEQADLNCDQSLNVIDVQIEILMALGKPLSKSLDKNFNNQPDCQEITIPVEQSCSWQWKTDFFEDYYYGDIWASDKNNIYASELTNSKLLHFNGQKWEEIQGKIMEDIPEVKNIYGLSSLWGIQENTLYTVGNFNTGSNIYKSGIFHFNGQNWQLMNPSFESSAYGLKEIWGWDKNNIYAAGGNFQTGMLLKYNPDNKLWNTLATKNLSTYLKIFGNSAQDVFILDENNGIIYELNEAGLNTKYEDPDWHFLKFWASSDSNIYSIAKNKNDNPDSAESLLKYNTQISAWEPIDLKLENFYPTIITGSTENNLYVFGYTQMPGSTNGPSPIIMNSVYAHYDGKEWSSYTLSKQDGKNHIPSNASITSEGMLAVIDNGSGEIYRYICE